MSDREEPTAYGDLSAEEAFELVGNEIRQQILLELSEPDPEGYNTRELSFSELYDRIDASVPSSQFNYHLQQLLGQFVESREEGTDHLNEEIGEGEAYALSPEGLLLVWTVRSTTATDEREVESFPTDFACHHCDDPVAARYENAIFNLECSGCGYHYEYNLTPPGVVEGATDHEEILDRVARYNRTYRGAFARGGCPLCGGGIERQFVDAAETNYPRTDLREAFVHATCTHCGFIDYLTVGESLVGHPHLVSFCLDHGLDVTDGPLWELPFVATDRAVSVEDRDPWRVRFAPTLDEETLTITLDETPSVTEVVHG